MECSGGQGRDECTVVEQAGRIEVDIAGAHQRLIDFFCKVFKIYTWDVFVSSLPRVNAL